MKCRLVLAILTISYFTACTKTEKPSASDTSSAETPVAQQLEGDPVTLTGTIKYKGTATKPKKVRMSADPVCVKQSKGKNIVKETLLVGTQGGLKNAFVYIDAKFTHDYPKGSTLPAITLDQNACTYTPHVWGVQTGQKIKILNSDPTLHNVNAMAKTNRSFNVGMATKGQSVEKTFSRPETMIKIKCDVHGWMATYAGVMDHPYFAVTDSNGNFTIKDLPPGNYTLKAWHEKLGTQSMDIAMTKPGAEESIEMSFQ